jgi:hypothetical protein
MEGTLNPHVIDQGQDEDSILSEQKKKDQQYLAGLGKSIPAEMTVKKDSPIPEYLSVGPGHDEIRKATEQAQQLHEVHSKQKADHYNGLIRKMRDLQKEKDRIKAAPYIREDLLEAAKNNLKEQQGKFKEELLKKHLSDCQAKHNVPFSGPSMSMLFRTEEYWQLAYFIIDEKDIEKAIKQLPGIGISTKDREKRIKEIDLEISKLRVEIDEEYTRLIGNAD